MKLMRNNYLIFLLVIFFSCNTSDEVISPEPSPIETLYFPPINSNTWESTTASTIDWNANELQPLLEAPTIEDLIKTTKELLTVK